MISISHCTMIRNNLSNVFTLKKNILTWSSYCGSLETRVIYSKNALFGTKKLKQFFFFFPQYSVIFFSVKIPFLDFIMQFDFLKPLFFFKLFYFLNISCILGGQYVYTKKLCLIFLQYLWSGLKVVVFKNFIRFFFITNHMFKLP